ncbi:hypothetical protein REPUB_Repub17cG0191200 [Reevesia pubescens]
MKHKGMKPNAITYCSLVSAYITDGSIKKVDSIFRQVENSDVILDTLFLNCIISASSQVGPKNSFSALGLVGKKLEKPKRGPSNLFGWWTPNTEFLY